jgi:hypothetical protein
VKKLGRILGLTLLAAALLYALDAVVLRARGQNGFAKITVNRYDVIPEKNGKVEFDYEPSVDETCVRALFPHQTYAPCWYLARHSEQQIRY